LTVWRSEHTEKRLFWISLYLETWIHFLDYTELFPHSFHFYSNPMIPTHGTINAYIGTGRGEKVPWVLPKWAADFVHQFIVVTCICIV